MSDLRLQLLDPGRVMLRTRHAPLGALLVDRGKIAPADLDHALTLQKGIDAPLGDIMVCEGLVSRHDVLNALAAQARATEVDLEHEPPAAHLASRLSSRLCLKYGAVPWRQHEEALMVACASPAAYARLLREPEIRGRQLVPVIVDEQQVQNHICALYGEELAFKAARRVRAIDSCRGWGTQNKGGRHLGLAVLVITVALLVAAPLWVATALSVYAAATLLLTTGLKCAALVAHVRGGASDAHMPPDVDGAAPNPPPTEPQPESQTQETGPELTLLDGTRGAAALRIFDNAQGFVGDLPAVNQQDAKFRLPRVSVLVPLLHEREIAGQLIDRLSRLTYPKSLLEVVLVLEEDDALTRETIARTTLPDWMRVIEVPSAGDLTTKPRALNYALDFCRGSIIGVWDAEDWPEADQIERVVMRFKEAPETTACLQGMLDYYNSRTNWLTRCFTIEYATWWRVFLPGIAKLGLVVPLGGTTLFFRRTALEDLGGWDAHNVTEDADLGVRLARRGYKTELLPTVTREEATSRAWPWVRQRSRWLKGFLVTYLVHMRRPRVLLQELGFWRFMGIQTLFLATVSQFAMAPLLLSFWALFLGLPHPVGATLGQPVIWSMIGLFIFSELVSLTAGLVAVSGRPHRHLIPFLPTMTVYFTLGTIASYKALWELARAPFYWDKTQHGVSRQTD